MTIVQTRKHPHTGRDVTGTLHDCGAWVSDEAVVGERVRPLGPATIWGGTIHGGTIWGGDIRGGDIRGSRDVLVVGSVGSEDQQVTLVRSDDPPHHLLRVGCWPADRAGAHIDELAGEVRHRCPDHGPEYAEIELLLRRRIAEWTPAGDASPSSTAAAAGCTTAAAGGDRDMTANNNEGEPDGTVNDRPA